MGGGIAYQSAYKNVPIVMKDINQSGIDLGIGEATKLLSKIVKTCLPVLKPVVCPSAVPLTLPTTKTKLMALVLS